jgi:hypothetical protein
MRPLIPILLLFLLAGCTTSPYRLCGVEKSNWSLLEQPPEVAGQLIEDMRSAGIHVEQRKNYKQIWFHSPDGRYYMCSRLVLPGTTGACGATKYEFVPKGDTFVLERLHITSC